MKIFCILSIALSLPASAQLAATVGPPRAPLGGRIAISMSNDSVTDYVVGQACPFEVRNAAGALVYDIDCPTFAPIPLPISAVATFWWHQRDNTGGQVPAAAMVQTAVPGRSRLS